MINTFGSERLGIIDEIIINHYLKNKNLKILKKLFGGLGTKRWINYFKNKIVNHNLVGLEVDYIYDNLEPL